MTKSRTTAHLVQDRRGEWCVQIDLGKGRRNFARCGKTQSVIYDRPEAVPKHVRSGIVPPLIREARARNMGAPS